MTNKNLANNLRVLRLFHNYSQTFLAKKLGVSQSDYSNIENGKTALCNKKEKLIEVLYQIKIADLTASTEDELMEYIFAKKKEDKKQETTAKFQVTINPLFKYKNKKEETEENDLDDVWQLEWIEQTARYLRYQMIKLKRRGKR
jgi:transcriptional regulator with XRE-family HTH domain